MRALDYHAELLNEFRASCPTPLTPVALVVALSLRTEPGARQILVLSQEKARNTPAYIPLMPAGHEFESYQEWSPAVAMGMRLARRHQTCELYAVRRLLDRYWRVASQSFQARAKRPYNMHAVWYLFVDGRPAPERTPDPDVAKEVKERLLLVGKTSMISYVYREKLEAWEEHACAAVNMVLSRIQEVEESGIAGLK